MRTDRFRDFAAALIGAAGVGQAEPFEAEGVAGPAGLKVVPLDGGKPVFLRVTRTSGPGGDQFTGDEATPFPDYKIPADLREAARD